MNYAKVIEDFKSGKIGKCSWKVVFDNDDGYWAYIGPETNEEEIEYHRNQMEEKYGSPLGYDDLVNLANAAGIPSEWV